MTMHEMPLDPPEVNESYGAMIRRVEATVSEQQQRVSDARLAELQTEEGRYLSPPWELEGLVLDLAACRERCAALEHELAETTAAHGEARDSLVRVSDRLDAATARVAVLEDMPRIVLEKHVLASVSKHLDVTDEDGEYWLSLAAWEVRTLLEAAHRAVDGPRGGEGCAQARVAMLEELLRGVHHIARHGGDSTFETCPRQVCVTYRVALRPARGDGGGDG